MEKKPLKGAKKPVKPAAKPQAEKPQAEKKPRKAKVKAKVEERPRLFGVHDIGLPAGAHKKKKLLGRGPGSGHGKTSTRGSKGQTSRAGRHFYLGFEGGQSPLVRKMPKRGFRNRFRKVYQIVNLGELNKIKEQVITVELLESNGLIASRYKLVKILGDGAIKKPVTVRAHAFSRHAAEAIAAGGGKTEIIDA
jgi:large subunit ribosomal protein L15